MADTFLDRLKGVAGIGAAGGAALGLGFGVVNQIASGSSNKLPVSNGLIGSPSADSVSNGNIWQGIDNALTGNLDFQRELEMLKRNQTFNAEQARIQREFEQYMSSTAFQRQAEDLIKAGYNPALVLGNGGASSPSGAAASSSGSHSSSYSSGLIGSLVNSLVNMSLNSARSNEALSAARLLDERAELIRESSNARNNYYNSRTRLNNEKYNNYSNESRALTRNRDSYSDYYNERTKILKRHNSVYETNENRKKNLNKMFDEVYNRLKRR